MERFAFVDDELEFPDEGGFDGGDVYFAVALGRMAVANLEKRAFYEYGIVDGGAGYEFLVIEVAAVDPWWGAVPATGIFWRGYAEAAEEGMEGDLDAFGPVADHFFCVEGDDSRFPIEYFIREEACRADGVVAVGDGEVDGLEAYFED